MNRLVADDQVETNGITIKDSHAFPLALRSVATIISYVFHPLFIPVYVTWLLVRVQFYVFSGFDEWNKTVVLIQSFVWYTFFPIVSTLLLKKLDFISSIHLKTQRDRIIPFIVCGIFYFWGWYVSHNLPDYPHEIVSFELAIFLASSLGLIANTYMKISMHAIAVGLMSTFVLMLGLSGGVNFGLYISIVLLVSGLVCTARLIASDHTQTEIYTGLFVGMVSQLIAYLFSSW
jgi:hypothetical protein